MVTKLQGDKSAPQSSMFITHGILDPSAFPDHFYNRLTAGSKPRARPYLTTFADIQGGMAAHQESLDVIPQTPPKMATMGGTWITAVTQKLLKAQVSMYFFELYSKTI